MCLGKKYPGVYFQRGLIIKSTRVICPYKFGLFSYFIFTAVIMPLPEGLKQYTKNRGITHEEFDAVRKWWPARKSNGRAWKVAIEDIEARNYNLDFKNPNGRAGVIHKSPEELVGEIEEKEREIAAILDDIKLAF